MPAKEHFFKNENHFASSGCSLFICHAQSTSCMLKITSKKKKNQSGLRKLKAEISNAEKAFFMFSASHRLTLIVILCFLKYHLACVCGITCTAPENKIQVDESRREELSSWSILFYYIFFFGKRFGYKAGSVITMAQHLVFNLLSQRGIKPSWGSACNIWSLSMWLNTSVSNVTRWPTARYRYHFTNHFVFIR